MRAISPAQRTAIAAGCVALMTVSGGMLWYFGYNYDGLQGSPLTKLHPFTYFIFAALFWRALQSGEPVAYARAKMARRPAAAWMLALAFLLVVTTVMRAGPGTADSSTPSAGRRCSPCCSTISMLRTCGRCRSCCTPR